MSETLTTNEQRFFICLFILLAQSGANLLSAKGFDGSNNTNIYVERVDGEPDMIIEVRCATETEIEKYYRSAGKHGS